MAPLSLRVRLVAVAALWVVLAMVAGFFLLSSIFRGHVTQQFYGELAEHVEELERLNRVGEPASGSLQSKFSDPRYDAPLSGYYWEVRSPDGVAFASASLQGRSIGDIPTGGRQLGDMQPHRITGPTGPLLVLELVSPLRQGSFTYIVGTDERHLETSVAEFDRILTVSLAGFGIVLVFSVLGFVTFGLAPFTSLARAMRRVRAGETSSIEGRYPTEVQPLVTELNTMISGQRDSLQRARAHAGNLAHGLKGPLAIIADEAFELERRGEGAAGSLITEQCRAMQVHIDHHIARARAQAMARAPGTRSSLNAVMGAIAQALTRLHARREIRLERDEEPNLVVAVDEQDLNELLANIIDNAFKHAGSRVQIHAAAVDAAMVRISVEDDGPGLPPEAREVVFAPGMRLDETKPGTGLGLAIVRDLVELYRGEVALGRSKLGGLLVEVRLPRIPS